MKWVVPYNSSWNRNGFFDDFDRLMDSFLMPVDSETHNFKPACDIDETTDHYLVSFDLPGVKKEDINIEVKDRHLVITGERLKEFKDTKSQHYERRYGKFQRSFMLPEKIDTETVEANFEDGVLQLLIPKTKEKSGKKIEISNQKSSGFFGKVLNAKKTDKPESEEK